MGSIFGILVDVSDSKRNSVRDRAEAEGGSWVKLLLKVANQLVKDDVSSSNQTFVLAFGRLFDPEVFDLLSTLHKADEEHFINDLKSRKSHEEIINEVLDSLERNGAVSVRTCVKMEILTEVFDATTAAAILYYLERNHDFTEMFVNECLLSECRSHPTPDSVVNKYWPISLGLAACAATVATSGFGAISAFALVTACIAQITKDKVKDYSIKNALEKGKLLLAEARIDRRVTVNKEALMSVQSAFKILHDSIADQATVQLVDEMTKTVEPNIYRRNPLIQAMRHSEEFFSDPQFANDQKRLYILTDGQQDDGWYPHQKLSDLGVKIMRCVITDENLDPSKFTLTISPISTLFEKRGLGIDNDNVEGMFYKSSSLYGEVHIF